MRGAWFSGMFMIALVAGCIEGPADEPVPTAETVFTLYDLPLPDRAVVVPGARETVQTVLWREDAQGEFGLDPTDFTGPGKRPTRDIAMTYRGIHHAYDEWGRSVLAHVFRFDPMDMVVSEVEFTEDGFSGELEWREAHREYLFDAADGRFMGLVGLTSETRWFVGPEYRDPFVYGFEADAFLWMALRVLDGDLDQGIKVGNRTVRFVPWDDAPPLPADGCRPHEVVVEDEIPPSSAVVDLDDVAGAGPDRHAVVLCIRDGVETDWVWRGDPATGDALWYERLEGTFDLVPWFGEVRPPAEFPREPWTELPPVLDLGVLPLPSIYAPPGHGRVDYGTMAQGRAAALHLNPDFIQYGLKHDTLYLSQLIAGFPDPGPTLLGGLLDIDLPAGQGESSWVLVSEGRGFYWGFTRTDRGGESQQESHMSYERGYDFDDADWEQLPPGGVLDLVPADHFDAVYPQIVPAHPELLFFNVWSHFSQEYHPDLMAAWFAFDTCFSEPSDDPHRFVALSAVTGRLFSAGNASVGPDNCSSGGSFRAKNPDGWMDFLDLDGGAPDLALHFPSGKATLLGPYSSSS